MDFRVWSLLSAVQAPDSEEKEEQYYVMSQWQLMRLRFLKHRLAVVAGLILLFMYTMAAFAGFFTPYDPQERGSRYMFHPPTVPQFRDEAGNWYLRPFVYGYQQQIDPVSFLRVYEVDYDQKYPINFFVRGTPYTVFGVFNSTLRLFGVEDGRIALFGTDQMGRDLYSRIIYGSQISLSVGLVGVAISLFLGIVIGGISGYYGGVIDLVVQRVMELLRSFPQIPLWMGLSAALPDDWTPLQTYFGITLVLSVIGWTTVAREVRGKFMSLRGEDFVLAARFSNARERRVIFRHILPSFTSHIIATVSLTIPMMILAETSLSFLGLGLRPPVVSWGVLLRQAQNIQAVVLYPWFFVPAFFVIIAVLCFNFLGDGLRDAADPYSN